MAEINKINIDYDFLRKDSIEGFRDKPYVPTCSAKSVKNPDNKACYEKPEGSAIGKSGVTIGSGFDLGQHNVYDLKRMGIPDALINKLKPYLEQKKDKAIKLLNDKQKIKNPLTADEVKQIDTAVKAAKAKQMVSKFESQTGKDFSTVPGAAQTAVFSLYYQYGMGAADGSGTLGKIWSSFKDEDYSKVADYMEGMDKYQQRRKEEAKLIRTVEKKK